MRIYLDNMNPYLILEKRNTNINNLQIIFQIQFVLLFSRQGKLRLQKWFESLPEKNKKKISRELITNILARKPKMSSFLELKEYKIVYKRYAELMTFINISSYKIVCAD